MNKTYAFPSVEHLPNSPLHLGLTKFEFYVGCALAGIGDNLRINIIELSVKNDTSFTQEIAEYCCRQAEAQMKAVEEYE